MSSGHNLTERYRTFAAKHAKIDNSTFSAFGCYVSNLFDECGPYQILDRLRNLAQHCQALVSTHIIADHGKQVMEACFDIDQLLKPTQFDMKGQLKKLPQGIADQMDSRGARSHNLSFTWTLEQYVADALGIAVCFYETALPYLKAREDEFNALISDVPNCIATLANNSAAAYIYDAETRMAHPIIGLEQSLEANQRLILAKIRERHQNQCARIQKAKAAYKSLG